MPEKHSLASLAPLGTTADIVPDIREENSTQVRRFAINKPYRLDEGKTIVFDWHRKRTGWIKIAGKGKIDYALASDLKFFDLFDSNSSKEDYSQTHCRPSFCAGNGIGTFELSSGQELLQPQSNAFRFLRITNNSNSTVTLDSIVLQASEFPAKPVGNFKCSDHVINTGWQMGIESVHLCTQPGDQSNVPVFAPFGEGYVQWDGCRRDREIWGGDLRPGALAWYYNFEDQTPIANSLYIIMNAQHCGCSEHGIFPGSGSTHQIVYEWAFWEVVCLWEYILHTGDEKLVRFAKNVMPLFLDWCEKKFSENPDGWIRSNMSWMYTIKLKNEVLPGLQAVAAIGFKAMENLFNLFDQPEQLKRVKILQDKITSAFHESFWNEDLKAYTFTADNGGSVRSDLATNCWAILADIVSPKDRKKVLNSIKKLHWTSAGSINISPVLDEPSAHNNNIWPYANAYEVSARFYSGDVDGALEVFKRYIKRIKSIGHNTLFEMINIDGNLPILEKGNTLSFCHAWAAQASWALQKYLLGVAPVKIGWKEFSFNPLPCKLEWIEGSIVTPYGTIDVEIDNSNGTQRGKVVHPEQTKCVERQEDFGEMEFISK